MLQRVANLKRFRRNGWEYKTGAVTQTNLRRKVDRLEMLCVPGSARDTDDFLSHQSINDRGFPYIWLT